MGYLRPCLNLDKQTKKKRKEEGGPSVCGLTPFFTLARLRVTLEGPCESCGWIGSTRLLPGPLLVKGHWYTVGIDPGSFQSGHLSPCRASRPRFLL